MSKRVATCVFIVTFFSAVVTPVFGHEQWILPNFFFTNDKSPWLGIEHTAGEQRFVPGHGLGSPLWIIHPEGWRMGRPSSIFVGQTRTVGEIELREPGTYRIETDSPAQYMTEIEVDGEKRWVSKPKDQLPGKKVVRALHQWSQTTTFVTVNEYTQGVLEANRCTFRNCAINTSKQDLCPKAICSSHSVERSISSEPTGPGLFGDGQRT